MEYRHLGKSGLKISALSLGSWLTFGDDVDVAKARALMRKAFESGINFFDNAEAYGHGEAEKIMGEVLKDFPREDLVVSTKIYWGGRGPNRVGTSWKRLVEGTRASLKRLRLEYVDLLYCHRPDFETPLEETVRAMDHLIRAGNAFYWGTSEWPAERIEEAFKIAERLNCIPPTMEQPEYNLLKRDPFETSYVPLFTNRGLGSTTWSPLQSGVLAGRYNDGIPEGSRLDKVEWLRSILTPEAIEQAKKLKKVAERLDCTMAQLAIAWVLRNPHVSSVILGATSIEQLQENLRALEAYEKVSKDVLAELDKIFPVQFRKPI